MQYIPLFPNLKAGPGSSRPVRLVFNFAMQAFCCRIRLIFSKQTGRKVSTSSTIELIVHQGNVLILFICYHNIFPFYMFLLVSTLIYRYGSKLAQDRAHRAHHESKDRVATTWDGLTFNQNYTRVYTYFLGLTPSLMHNHHSSTIDRSQLKFLSNFRWL